MCLLSYWISCKNIVNFNNNENISKVISNKIYNNLFNILTIELVRLKKVHIKVINRINKKVYTIKTLIKTFVNCGDGSDN